MVSKSRPDSVRDTQMWSGLGLFIGFVALVVATVETFNAGTRAIPFALIGIGFMLGGIGARLQYLAPPKAPPEPVAPPVDPSPEL